MESISHKRFAYGRTFALIIADLKEEDVFELPKADVCVVAGQELEANVLEQLQTSDTCASL